MACEQGRGNHGFLSNFDLEDLSLGKEVLK